MGAVLYRILLQEPLHPSVRRRLLQWASAPAPEAWDERHGVVLDYRVRYTPSTDLAPGGVVRITAVAGPPARIIGTVCTQLREVIGRPVRWIVTDPDHPAVCESCGVGISAHAARYRGVTRCRSCAQRESAQTQARRAQLSAAARAKHQRDAEARRIAEEWQRGSA